MSPETNALQLTGAQQSKRVRERLYRWLLLLCAAVSIVVTVSIVFALAFDAVLFFELVSPREFFTTTSWVPPRDEFGAVPIIFGTLAVTAISALVAIPTGVLAAAYLSEYASTRTRAYLKPGLEILAGIPTVVYGYLALVYLTPFLRQVTGLGLGTFNILSASLMVGILIIPIVSSLSEDAMSAVPDELRQAGYGLGATKFDVTTGVVIPAAASGIFASFILALSRAIGETMVVAMAMGLRPRMPAVKEGLFGIPYLAPIETVGSSGQTMTSAMVQAVTTDVSAASPTYKSMFALGLTLFAITFAMNYASNRLSKRYREEYQ
ncbi:phosphate ABC transporter permease subunit PstC [Natronosalvus rutilus]|uniref:Phosphate transport system permease protein n=1 Tax=Natronosalvus rutilus TaxID=2953753 RepID=A0A9E7NF73_9EURY|nr:phosphate ABC transporter permease subunit PstC [Natronosalvus rutilus]UTF55928.1 phosphate ABC transporter permease subunit PstC [Natronosalvus rutilus]